MAQKKNFQELNLSNTFLFSAAMTDSEICQLVIGISLDKEISGVSVNTEHTILFSSDFRYVRLDVMASDEAGAFYNIEMENEAGDRKQLPKRSRFYQAQADVHMLQPGDRFSSLPCLYVIFICTFDPFGKGLYRYIIDSVCREDGEYFGEGIVRVFLNTKGNNPGEVPQTLVNFLKYIENSTDECVGDCRDENVKKIHNKLTHLKESREWEARYMQMQELLERTEARGEARGEAQGEAKILKVIQNMTKDGIADSIIRLQDDKAFRHEMFQKYDR